MTIFIEASDFAIVSMTLSQNSRSFRSIRRDQDVGAVRCEFRLRRPTIQGDPRPPRRTCWMTAVAPTTNTLRKASPPLVMTPSLTLPAVEWSFGVKPIQAATRHGN
jgi:hypothetical protein